MLCRSYGTHAKHMELNQNILKTSPNGRPEVTLGAPFGGLELPWGRFECHFGVRRCYFLRFVSGNCVLVISMLLCSRIAAFTRPGATIGAMFYQKSCPSRLWGALATIECEVLCRSYGTHAKHMELNQNIEKYKPSQRSKAV